MASKRASLEAETPNRSGRLITLGILMRLTVDTTMRMFYPYLPEISRGLGISLSQAGLLMSIRSAMIFPSPLFGIWNDRHGPRALLTTALLVQSLCLWWVSTAEGMMEAVPPVVLLGLTASAFIPTMQATISEYVPFHRRGRALAIVEFSWALTGLVVLPLVGLLMVSRGWQAPLRAFAFLSLAAAVLPSLLPRREVGQGRPRLALGKVARLVLLNPSARAAIATNGLMFIAAESFFVTYGAWLEQAFGMAPDEIGRVAGLLGVAELLGSGLSSLIIDRVGKRRGVGVGLLVMTLTVAALPALDATLALAIAGMFAFTVSFEFSIVSNIGLLSEQVPSARGMVLSLGVMAAALTRTVSAYAGLGLFEWKGLPATSTMAALGTGLAFLVLWRWVQDKTGDGEGW